MKGYTPPCRDFNPSMVVCIHLAHFLFFWTSAIETLSRTMTTSASRTSGEKVVASFPKPRCQSRIEFRPFFSSPDDMIRHSCIMLEVVHSVDLVSRGRHRCDILNSGDSTLNLADRARSRTINHDGTEDRWSLSSCRKRTTLTLQFLAIFAGSVSKLKGSTLCRTDVRTISPEWEPQNVYLVDVRMTSRKRKVRNRVRVGLGL